AGGAGRGRGGGEVAGVGPEQPPRGEREEESAGDREREAPPPAEPGHAQGDACRGTEDQGELAARRARRATHEVIPEEIVGHGRVDLGAGHEGAEWRRHRVAEPESGRSYEHDPAAERAGRRTALEHVDGGEAREGPRRAAEAHERTPVRVQRHLAITEPPRPPPRPT